MSPSILSYQNILPKISNDVFIANTAVVIGDVEISKASSIWYGCVVRGDVNLIRIGERTNIQDGSIIHVARDGQGTFIGDNVTVGHMVLLHACTIEDGAFIGMKACIMDNAIVEEGAMVAAGALVTPGKRVRCDEIWGGSPAKYMRQLTIQEKEQNKANTAHYVKLAQRYLHEFLP